MVSCIMYHASCNLYHVLCIMRHVSCIMCHVSCHVTSRRVTPHHVPDFEPAGADREARALWLGVGSFASRDFDIFLCNFLRMFCGDLRRLPRFMGK